MGTEPGLGASHLARSAQQLPRNTGDEPKVAAEADHVLEHAGEMSRGLASACASVGLARLSTLFELIVREIRLEQETRHR